jgi:hypothetical protein
MSVFTKLNSVIDEKGAAYVVLIDPDRKNEDSLESYVESANISGVDSNFIKNNFLCCTSTHRNGYAVAQKFKII